jgi:hypothetical protein
MLNWINGPAVYAAGQDRSGNVVADMVGANVGYFGDPGQSNPRAYEVYTAHIVVGVNFPPLGGVVNRTRVVLPSNTSFDYSHGWFACFRQSSNPARTIDATNDPSANCIRVATQLPDGSFDLGFRDLPQGNLFEIQFNLKTTEPIQNGLLRGFVDSQYGQGPLSCVVSVSVFGPAPRSGRLRVQAKPKWLSTGKPVSYSIIVEDTGSGEPLDGTATIHNYTSAGQPDDFQVPTNTPLVHTFHIWNNPPGADMAVPWGEVTVPGYDADRGKTFWFVSGF